MKYIYLFWLALGMAQTLQAITPQTLLRGDEFVVYQNKRSFSSGYSTLPRSLVVSRPSVGSYLQGRVRVKTINRYGVHALERSINGSTANVVLSSVGMTSVSSAFTSSANPSSEAVNAERTAGIDRIYDVAYSDAIDPYDLCMRLLQSPDVEYAVPIMIQKTNFKPNDSMYVYQSGLRSMDCERAWDVCKGSKNTLIAIVDTGVFYNHEDLIDHLYTNPGEIPNNNIDDDNNGFVDDIHGWDFVGNISRENAEAGLWRPDNDPQVDASPLSSGYCHGTQIAGCAAATTNNALRVASPAFQCSLLPLKCGYDSTNTGVYNGYAAVKYAADMGAHVINCSWGSEGIDPSGQDVIDYALARGSLVVASAGNDGEYIDYRPQSPASLNGVLAVGSTDDDDTLSSFSSRGWDVDVYAPGEFVPTLDGSNRSSYAYINGTSASSALVAGVAALVKSQHPSWTPLMIMQQIRSTVDIMSGYTPDSVRPGYYGSVNAYKAVTYNNSFTSGLTIPGITVTDVDVPGGVITSKEPVDVTITVTNLLGESPDTELQFDARSTDATITPLGIVRIGDISNNESRKRTFTIQLHEHYKWYQSEVLFELEVRNGTYTNYVLVRIPVRLPSNNTQTVIANIPYSTYQIIDCTPDNAIWSTGRIASSYTTVAVGSQGGVETSFRAPAEVDLLSAISSTTAVVTGSDYPFYNLYRTTDRGETWSTSRLPSYFYYLKMFNSAVGVAVADSASRIFKLMRTSNGGATWHYVSSDVTPVNNGERALENVGFSLGDNAWVATTARRILHTTDRGKTWTAALFVPTKKIGLTLMSIAFKDELHGVLLYDAYFDARHRYGTASSTDGGATWLDHSDSVASYGLTPVEVASPGGHHLLLGQAGEVLGSDDNGKNWQVVLSKVSQQITTGVAINAPSSTLFQGGRKIYMLKYRYNGPNMTRILNCKNQLVDFGVISTGQTRQRDVSVESSGEADVIVSSVTITPDPGTPDTAFRMITQLNDTVEAGASDKFSIRFYSSQDTGTFGATVTIASDATPATTTAKLTIRVQPTTSVDELTDVAFSMSPNPAHAETTLLLDRDAEASLYTSSGVLVGTWQLQQAVQQTIDLRSAAAGMYVLRITSAAGHTAYPLTVIR